MFQCQNCEYWDESTYRTDFPERERQGDCTCPKWKLRCPASSDEGNRSSQSRELSDALLVTHADFSCGFFKHKSVQTPKVLTCSRCSTEYTRDDCDYIIDGKHVCVKCKRPGEWPQLACITLSNVEIGSCTVLGCSSSSHLDPK